MCFISTNENKTMNSIAKGMNLLFSFMPFLSRAITFPVILNVFPVIFGVS